MNSSETRVDMKPYLVVCEAGDPVPRFVNAGRVDVGLDATSTRLTTRQRLLRAGAASWYVVWAANGDHARARARAVCMDGCDDGLIERGAPAVADVRVRLRAIIEPLLAMQARGRAAFDLAAVLRGDVPDLPRPLMALCRAYAALEQATEPERRGSR